VSKVTTENLPGGMSHYEVSGVTMDWLAKSLDGLGGMPVINATGSRGDITRSTIFREWERHRRREWPGCRLGWQSWA
jgi:hypothetical protein